MSVIEKRLAEFRTYEAFCSSAREYIREDHAWLYAVIADKRLMVQRAAHWRR